MGLASAMFLWVAVCTWILPSGMATTAVLPALDTLEAYVVKVHTVQPDWSVAQWRSVLSQRKEHMASAGGKSMVCFVPREGSGAHVPQEGGNDQQPPLLTPSSQAGASVRSMGCLRKLVGFWTYEVCPFHSVKQFREESTAGSTAPSGSTATMNNNLGSHAPGKDAVVTTGARPTFTQDFAGGDDGRSAQVQYVCDPAALPKGIDAGITAIQESPPHAYTVTVSVSGGELCSLLATPLDAVRAINGTCVEKPDGWWTYRACLGGDVRQFHRSQEAVEADFVLGVFDWQFGTLEDTPGKREKAVQRRGESPWGSLGPVTKGELLPPALVQLYSKGTNCDMTNTPRQTEVRLVCSPADTLLFHSVREAATCQYVVTLGSSFVCQHPEVGADKEDSRSTPSQVHCMPEGAVPRTSMA